jgi:hypothetical protein
MFEYLIIFSSIIKVIFKYFIYPAIFIVQFHLLCHPRRFQTLPAAAESHLSIENRTTSGGSYPSDTRSPADTHTPRGFSRRWRNFHGVSATGRLFTVLRKLGCRHSQLQALRGI